MCLTQTLNTRPTKSTVSFGYFNGIKKFILVNYFESVVYNSLKTLNKII